MILPVLAQRPASQARVRNAWSVYWQEPGQSTCISNAPEITAALTAHWATFAQTLAPNARVLDLACGAGAVARALISERADIHVTGIDFAKIPLTLRPNIDLLADTAMEALPFADNSFAAAVSQFGFEYSHTPRAAREMARVLAPGAPVSLLVHHGDGSIVSASRARLTALAVFLGQDMRRTFCAGDAATFNAQMAALTRAHPHDRLILDLARALPARVTRAECERLAIWNAVEDAIAPELCLAESLEASYVAPERLDDWLCTLCPQCDVQSVSTLRNADTAIAWRIEGVRKG
jgi:SAM-dependent methyltransferase